MTFQKQTKTLVAVAVAACATFASFNASALILIGKRTSTAPKQGTFIKLSAPPSAGMVITLPGAVPLTVTRIIATQTAPAPVTIVPPITPSAANKTLARVLLTRKV